MFKNLVAACALFTLPTAAIAQDSEAIDLADYDSYLAVEPTQVLTLGTPHFSGWRDFIDRPQLDAALAPVLAKLEAWGPDTIAVENISGANCAHLERYGIVYANAANSYCRDIGDAGDFTGLTREKAEEEALTVLQDGGPDGTPASRRHLAALFLASGDHLSALVQWLRLDEADRVAGEELSEAMAERLNGMNNSLNESTAIGVELAVRLGHERIYQVDDHSADQLYIRTNEAFGPRMREIWSSGDMSMREKYAARMEQVKEDRDLLSLYRWFNSVEVQDATIRNDFAKGLADDQEPGVGQDYANWWQVRNMRMVANIVAAASLQRSKKTLAIVGASHKPYYDAYLDMMHHIENVDTVEFLAE